MVEGGLLLSLLLLRRGKELGGGDVMGAGKGREDIFDAVLLLLLLLLLLVLLLCCIDVFMLFRGRVV